MVAHPVLCGVGRNGVLASRRVLSITDRVEIRDTGALNQVWDGRITCLRTCLRGFICLATAIDCYSKKVVGRSITLGGVTQRSITADRTKSSSLTNSQQKQSRKRPILLQKAQQQLIRRSAKHPLGINSQLEHLHGSALTPTTMKRRLKSVGHTENCVTHTSRN